MNNTNHIIEVFNKNAALYASKYMDQSTYHTALDQFCLHLPEKNIKILDMACGPGNITHYLLEKRPEWKITGTDIAPNMLELARKNNPNAFFKRLDCRALNTLEDSFHGIICGFGLPYLSHEEAIQFIQNIYDKLLPGGIAYLSTIEDDYKKSKWTLPSTGEGPALLIYYHEAGYLIDACTNSGFKMLSLLRTRPKESADSNSELILLLKKDSFAYNKVK